MLNDRNIIERKIKESILTDIDNFKKQTIEPDHCDYMFFLNDLIKKYEVDLVHQAEFKIYISKILSPWLRQHQLTNEV